MCIDRSRDNDNNDLIKKEARMAVYRCMSCGYIFDEEKEGKSIKDIDQCPRCKQPDDRFVLVEDKDIKNRIHNRMDSVSRGTAIRTLMDGFGDRNSSLIPRTNFGHLFEITIH